MRKAPSTRMTSALTMTFSAKNFTVIAYSDADPSRFGNGVAAVRAAFAESGNPAIIGVSNGPGAMVLTRTPTDAKSRAVGSILGGVALSEDLRDVQQERRNR